MQGGLNSLFMQSSSSSFVVVSGRSNAPLAEAIAGHLNARLVPVSIGEYPSGETHVQVLESVRNKNVILVQSAQQINSLLSGPSPNDLLMETIMLVDACRRAGGNKIILVLPSLPYTEEEEDFVENPEKILQHFDSKNDLQVWHRNSIFAGSSVPGDDDLQFYQKLCEHEKQFSPRHLSLKQQGKENINFHLHPFKLIAKMLECTGANLILTLSLSRPQLIGFFTVALDEVPLEPLISDHFSGTNNSLPSVIVVTEISLARRGSQIAKALNCPFVILTNWDDAENDLQINIFGDVVLFEEDANDFKRIARTGKVLKQKNKSISSVSLFVLNFMISDEIEVVMEAFNSFDKIITSNSVDLTKLKSENAEVEVINLCPYICEVLQKDG